MSKMWGILWFAEVVEHQDNFKQDCKKRDGVKPGYIIYSVWDKTLPLLNSGTIKFFL